MPEPPLQPAAFRSSRTDRIVAEPQASPRVVRKLPVIPERYALRDKDGMRFLECDEAPRLRVVIDPQTSMSRTEALALGERVILLDGAGSFGPLIDNERDLYNLDHHAGCERLFTLSTCEQALLLVQSGLELSEGDWKIHANDPDLDTVLAIWCLLNHRRLRELRPEARDVLLPLLRLEGAIDANGHQLALFCGLTTAVIEQTQRRIDDLLARERGLKQTGSWGSKNVHAYTLEMLRAVDVLVYSGEDFGDYTRIEEIYGHVEIAPRRVAVACRDRSGIYMVEQHLKARWGDQLSLIALENQPGQYTLRRVSSVAAPQLDPAYELLNRVDAAVDGRPTSKRWGGSQDIGGSPRPQGTRLSAEDVLDTLARAYRSSTWWSRTRRTVGALLLGMCCLLAWPAAGALASLTPPSGLSAGLASAYQASLASLLLLGCGALGIRVASQRRPWVFGWRTPANGGGWWLLPIGLFGALPAAAWGRPWLDAGAPTLAAVLVAAALGLAAIELWFRGLVHGLFTLDFPLQHPRGPWLLSRGAWVSAAAYACVVATVVAVWSGELLRSFPAGRIEGLALITALAFGVGLALAAIRERSLSLLPGVVSQLVGLAVGTAVAIALR